MSVALDQCSPVTGASVGPLLPVTGAGTTVPLVDGTRRPYVDLDSAASTPALVAVADRVGEVLPYYASVHRGAGYLSGVSTALYESSRAAIARFVDARPDDVAIITRNTTDSLNLLAAVVPAGPDGAPGRVLVLDSEHHANLLPWLGRGAEAVTVLSAEPTVAATLEALAAALAAQPFALVAVAGASNVTGEALPLDDVIALAHVNGARVVVDGAQLVPHRSVSLVHLDADYVAFSGHKTYAPFGAGALVGRRDWLDAGTPYLAGGGAVRDVQATRTLWQPAPARHEAGSPNVLGAIALAEACAALSALPPGALEEHEEALRSRLVDGLERLDGVEVLRIWPDSEAPLGIVAFTVADHDAGLVAAYLSAEHGIGVRDGRFCAHRLLQRLGASHGALRASVGVGTSSEAVDRLLEGLAAFLEHGPQAEYAVVDHGWAVVGDTRPLPTIHGLDALATTAAAGCGPVED
ncbi:MAG: aminotransferase class [Actinotalea sp.]|nr:aminotransferase class [Actinotalea sp.]